MSASLGRALLGRRHLAGGDLLQDQAGVGIGLGPAPGRCRRPCSMADTVRQIERALGFVGAVARGAIDGHDRPDVARSKETWRGGSAAHGRAETIQARNRQDGDEGTELLKPRSGADCRAGPSRSPRQRIGCRKLDTIISSAVGRLASPVASPVAGRRTCTGRWRRHLGALPCFDLPCVPRRLLRVAVSGTDAEDFGGRISGRFLAVVGSRHRGDRRRSQYSHRRLHRLHDRQPGASRRIGDVFGRRARNAGRGRKAGLPRAGAVDRRDRRTGPDRARDRRQSDHALGHRLQGPVPDRRAGREARRDVQPRAAQHEDRSRRLSAARTEDAARGWSRRSAARGSGCCWTSITRRSKRAT